MYGINNAYHIVNILRPQTMSGALASDHVSMKGYNHADVIIEVGAHGSSETSVVGFDQMTLVGTAGTTTLPLTDYYVSGGKIFVTNWNGTAWSDDEQVTGATLSASLETFAGNYMTVFDMTTGVVAAETITGGTSGATAVAVNAYEYEDVMIKRVVGSNTFTISAVDNVTYVVPVAATSFTDGYDVFHVDLGSPSGTILLSSTAILYKGRYMGANTPISAIYD